MREKEKGNIQGHPCLTFNFTHNFVSHEYIKCNKLYGKLRSSSFQYVDKKTYRRSLYYYELTFPEYSIIVTKNQ